MGQSLQANQIYSWETYLQLEAQSELRYEYHDGVIVNMAGGTLKHNKISTNANFVLKSATRKSGCDDFAMDAKLFRPQSLRYFYPDGIVTCNPLDLQSNDGVRNPLLVLEVLSETTYRVDFGLKLQEYLAIPSLQHYLLIEQDKPLVQHYKRAANNSWEILFYRELTDTLEIPEIGLSFTLAELYVGITFDEEAMKEEDFVDEEKDAKN